METDSSFRKSFRSFSNRPINGIYTSKYFFCIAGILVDGNFELQDKNIIVQNTNFVSYFDVNFKYNNHIFQWWGNPNDKELDVYLLKENEDYCERQNPTSDKNTDEDKYFCFRVTKNMSTDDFLKKLDCLIQQACAKEAGKDCFKDCPNEKGNHLS